MYSPKHKSSFFPVYYLIFFKLKQTHLGLVAVTVPCAHSGQRKRNFLLRGVVELRQISEVGRQDQFHLKKQKHGNNFLPLSSR